MARTVNPLTIHRRLLPASSRMRTHARQHNSLQVEHAVLESNMTEFDQYNERRRCTLVDVVVACVVAGLAFIALIAI